MKNIVLLLTLTLLTGCDLQGLNLTKTVQETLGVLIVAGLVYSGGVLLLGHLTDIKWLKQQAEERSKGLLYTLIICAASLYFEKDIGNIIERATNIFNTK